jgi:ribose transport system permease protein
MSMFTNTNGDPKSDFGILAEEKESLFKSLPKTQTFQIVSVLFIITAIFSAIAPSTFFTLFNFRNIIINISVFAVLGVGMTFVIITAGIDLSVGSVLVFSSVIAVKAIIAVGSKGWGATFVGIFVALVVATAWGALNGWLVSIAKVPAFIVTLGSLSAALGVSQIITGGIDLRGATPELVDKIGFGNIYEQIPVLGVIAVVVVILGGILLHKTKFGLLTYAVGSNNEACRRVGINVNRQLILVYSLMGFTAGIGGIMSLAMYQQTTIAGQSNTALTVIAGVVIGGTSLFGGYGTIFGTMIGLFIPIVLQTGFIIIGVVPFWQNVVVGVFLVAAVYVDTARRDAADGGGKGLKKRSKRSTS